MSELVNLAKLTPPNVLESLNFEDLLAERKSAFLALMPTEEQAMWAARLELETEPVVKLLEENCYLQLLERTRINNAAKACMLAYATGSDLDILAANFNVQRLTIKEADLTTTPPTLAEMESDENFRTRTQLAFESLSVAGPKNSYIYHAFSAHSDVADVTVISPSPAFVTVTILSHQNQGQANEDLLKAVETALNDENIRPIGDRVLVQSATIVPYQINAILYINQGPEIEPIKAEALTNLTNLTEKNHRLGQPISLSSIYAALHIEGVQRVELNKPTSDILFNYNEAGFCSEISLKTVINAST